MSRYFNHWQLLYSPTVLHTNKHPIQYLHKLSTKYSQCNIILIVWKANWLTDLLNSWLMLPDKDNLSYRLVFSTVQCCFILGCAFLPTTNAPMHASWFYKTLLSLVPHSSLCYCISKDSRFAHYGFIVRPGKSSASRDASNTISLFIMLCNVFKVAVNET